MERVNPESLWNTPVRVMVIGHARHGKDTVGDILAKNYGLRFTSSSLFCAEKIMMPAFAQAAAKDAEPGSTIPSVYETVADCFEDRHNHREFWHDKITEYCEGDLSRLCREIFEAGNQIYVGCRNDREYLQAKGEGVFNVALWVDRSRHVKPESEKSMKLAPWMADEVIDNNGSLEDLERNTIRIFNSFVVAYRKEWRRLREEAR